MKGRIHIKFFSLLLSILICLFATDIVAQVTGESGVFLCSFKPGAAPLQLLDRWEKNTPWHCSEFSKVSDLMQIWMIRSDCPEADMPLALQWLNDQPELVLAQRNLITEYRGPEASIEPNDPLFFQQWHLSNTENPDAALMMPQAWMHGTGGLSPLGDTLVVAVIDAGIQDNHPDLMANMWKNNHEVPDDFLDNDLNGYVDDYRGWNVWTQDDNISNGALNHGTQVVGVLGAAGNNGEGISGVLWNVKTLFISGSGSVAGALASFDYVLKMRRLYQESKGQKGAFIVALNCSWGINYGQASQAPLWCAALDSLGYAGILTIAATANLPIDIDLAGDLPGVCPSPFLITVTSLNQLNEKAVDASWGSEHVDLGAYGVGVLTTQSGNAYGLGFGTSFAAPQVSGGIALLYSAECHELALKAQTQPAAAAAHARNLLFDSGVETAALEGISKTGKRLNISRLMQEYALQCQECPSPYGLSAAPDGQVVLLAWKTTSAYLNYTLRWRQKGSNDWHLVTTTEKAQVLSGLTDCVEYEFQVRGQCNSNTQSEWSDAFVFTAPGCCDAPAGLAIHASGDTYLHLKWHRKTKSDKFWLEVYQDQTLIYAETHLDTSLLLEGLSACTQYTAMLYERCGNGNLSTAASKNAGTLGCGACLEAPYCFSKADNAAQEWIASVSLGSWLHESGAAGNGYQLFTSDLISPPFVQIGKPANIQITPGFMGQPKFEHFRVFIDWNQDGDFEDAQELAFDPGFAINQACSGQILAPEFAMPGLTRMRISMKMKNNFSQPAEPCEYFQFGQVEDYCLRVAENNATSTGAPTTDKALFIWPSPADNQIWVKLPVVSDISFVIKDLSGRFIRSGVPDSAMGIALEGITAGVYLLEIFTADRHYAQLFVKQ